MFFLHLDVKELDQLSRDMQEKLRKLLQQEAQNLSFLVYNKVLENARAKLHSRREMYEKALSIKQVSNDTWLIKLDKSAVWIDDGMSQHEMIDKLLKGRESRAIPFAHNKRPDQQTPQAQSLTEALRKEMRSRKIPYAGIEKNPDGSPKLGLLHSFDVADKRHPLKTHHGPQEGRGAIGKPKQGWTGDHFLDRVRIYQREVEVKNPKTGKKEKTVQRGIVTFRMVSKSQKGSGKWVYPGIEGIKAMDEAYEFALKEWENLIKPRIVEKVTGGSL